MTSLRASARKAKLSDVEPECIARSNTFAAFFENKKKHQFIFYI